MNLYNRVIKAPNVNLPVTSDIQTSFPSVLSQTNAGGGEIPKQVISNEEEPVRFRGVCHLPTKDVSVTSRENYKAISAKIEEVKKQAEEKIKIAEKSAHDKGFSEGLKDGINRGKKELSLTAESVAKLIVELKTMKKQLMEGSEKEIIDLAFLIAGKVIHKEVSTGREVILSVLKDAMDGIQERSDVRVRLNPGDYRHIMEAKPDFFEKYSDIIIEKDEKIGQGGAMIETNSGTVDARLDQQLNKIMESLCDEHRF